MYYILIVNENGENKITVAYISRYDINDYKSDQFLKDEDGDYVKFNYHSDAKRYLLDNFKTEFIASEYQSESNSQEFFRQARR